MTFFQGLAYVMRYAWLWPLLFWLRPLEVIERVEQDNQEWAELACALLGSASWGAVAGTLIWIGTGDITAIWVLAFAITFAVAGAGSVYIGIAAAGIVMSQWLPSDVVNFFILTIATVTFVFSVWAVFSERWSVLKMPNWAENVLAIPWLVLLPLAAFALFPRSKNLSLNLALSPTDDSARKVKH
jgi:hypothetical protein